MTRQIKIGLLKMRGAISVMKFYWRKVNGMIAQRDLLKSWPFAKDVSRKLKTGTKMDNKKLPIIKLALHTFLIYLYYL